MSDSGTNTEGETLTAPTVPFTRHVKLKQEGRVVPLQESAPNNPNHTPSVSVNTEPTGFAGTGSQGKVTRSR